jgi:ABC-type multidrug transport system permease subunit
LWHIAGKEITQTRRDRLAFLFTIVLPVIFTLFLGLLIGGGDGGPSKLPLALNDADESAASRQLVETLRATPLLDIKVMAATEIDQAVQDQDVAAGLEIPNGYGNALEASTPITVEFIHVETSSGAQSALEAVQAVVSHMNVSNLAAATAAEQVSIKLGRPLDDALLAQSAALAETQLAAPAASVEVTSSGSSGTVQQIGGFDQSSSGSLVNWVLFGLLSVTTGLAWERRSGLIRRLGVSGVHTSEIFGGKLLAMMVITFVQQLFLILLGQLAFRVDYFNSPLALVFVMVSLSLFAASVGLLVSSVFRSEQAVIATTVIAAQLLAALGGAWFPLEITSSTFSRVAHFLPTTWVVDSLHGIILKDWGVEQVLRPMGFVWIWIVVLFGLAVWRFRPE